MTNRDNLGALEAVHEALLHEGRRTGKKAQPYHIPSLWMEGEQPGERLSVNPFHFFEGVITKILHAPAVPIRRDPPSGGEWTKEAVIYNAFVRTTTAFDHNGNGHLDLSASDDGFRETGTFLKLIALLPTIRTLGVNTIHLLPITSIGHDGNKGSLGSPYAIRNPYTLDANLSEPALRLDVETEFRAFTQAAHHLGLRVVVEFVFRTAAKDSDWVPEHPEWFYWIREAIGLRASGQTDEQAYGSPIFHPDELARIHHDVELRHLDNLIPPHQVHRDFFTLPPEKGSIIRENGRYVGTTKEGVRVKIPGAFADWPPDDNQPPWGDVTYLRMFDHPQFNYIAYNTIRMYDSRLTREEHINRPLWDKIVGIIPHYQREFGIDGVMIDMGHALPPALMRTMVLEARRNDPDFAFWAEDFSITTHSREEGYNSVIGFIWIDEHHPSKIREFVHKCAEAGWPIPSFATPESHNTPRAASRGGGVVYSRWSWALNCMLPAIPFIHSGFELAETYPINTGLDFSVDQIKSLPSEKLPLFSEYQYDWMNPQQFTSWIAAIASIRKEYADVIVDADPRSVVPLSCSNGHFLGFLRIGRGGAIRLAFLSNMNFHNSEQGTVHLPTSRGEVEDLIEGDTLQIHDQQIELRLAPGQCRIFEL